MKNNLRFFPRDALLAVLKARFGNRPAGHWVTFTAEISKVELFVMAYAWRQTGVCFIVSTCGRTVASKVKYRSYFQDEYGATAFRELLRPDIDHFLFQFF